MVFRFGLAGSLECRDAGTIRAPTSLCCMTTESERQTKFQRTDREARHAIQLEAALRAAKTERLRQLRVATEAAEPEPVFKPKRTLRRRMRPTP